MAKNFENIKKELDAELEAIYNRDENKRKYEKINDLAAVRNEIAGKEKEYDNAVKNEDFDTAVDIQTVIEHLKKKETIISKLVNDLKSNIPDYPHDDIIAIAGKMVSYANERNQELLSLYHQKLLEVEKVYDEFSKEISGFYFYLQDLKGKSSGHIPYWFQSSPNGASSVSEYISEAARGLK